MNFRGHDDLLGCEHVAARGLPRNRQAAKPHTADVRWTGSSQRVVKSATES
jgi:hypothetical protein